MSIKELVVELSEQALKSDALVAETASEAKLPEATGGRLLCIPANDEASPTSRGDLIQRVGRVARLLDDLVRVLRVH